MGKAAILCIVLHKLKKELVLFGGDRVVVDAEHAGSGVMQVYLKQEFVVLECCPEAAFLT